MRGHLNLGQVEARIARGADRGQHDGKVLRQAARHDSVCRDDLDGGGRVAGTDRSEGEFRIVSARQDHLFNTAVRRDDHGEAVRQLSPVQVLRGCGLLSRGHITQHERVLSA